MWPAGQWISVCMLVFTAHSALAEQCVGRYSALSRNPRLQRLRSIVPASGSRGFVNGTKGSYFVITTQDDEIRIQFFTSGLFDLYGISREGPLSFCDDGDSLYVLGLERKDLLVIQGESLQIGKGGPRMLYTPGAMPDLLQRLHPDAQRGIASEP